MSTENSAVSDLLRRTHTRRLQTDPADSFLFQPSEANRGPARRTQAQRATRWGEDLSAVAEVVAPAQHLPVPRPTVARPSRPELRSNRSYAWLLVLATLVAGGLGVGGAWYFDRADANHGATMQDIVAQVAATPVPVAPAPIAEPPAITAPVVAPTLAPTVAAPTNDAAEAKPADANPAPAHVVHKHVAKKRVAKRAKAAPATHAVAEKAAPAHEAPAAHEAAPKSDTTRTAPVSRKPVAQHDDNEDPLR